MAKDKVKKVVLAYSGGLDTSVIVPWLKQHYDDCEVICFTADLGQEEELAGLEEKALASGASKVYVHDLREEFLNEYVFPTLQAGAVYEREYLLGTSFARPLIAKHMVAIAEAEDADAVAHGCTGKGNDQVRFELGVMALNPKLKVIAPWREWNIRSREDALAYAATHNIPLDQTEKDIYSRDRNIFHLSHEGGPLEDPWNEPPKNMYKLTVSPEDAPDDPEYVEIGFDKGNPISINGKKVRSSGSMAVNPQQSTKYLLTARNREGQTAAQEQTIRVVVPEPKIVRFEAKSPITKGSSSTLTWETLNTAQVEISGVGRVPMSGTKHVRPNTTTTYTLIAKNRNGSQTWIHSNLMT